MTVAVTLVALFSVFQWADLTAVPTGVSPTGQSAPTAPASESPAATIDATPTKPTGSASAIEQSVVPDPLASLDPADRVVAEKIRDLLGAKSDAILPSKSERMAVESRPSASASLRRANSAHRMRPIRSSRSRSQRCAQNPLAEGPKVGDGPVLEHATGNLDARTVKELNGPIRDKQIDLVIANMERAGAGTRATSVRPMSSSTNPTLRSR
jgi:hypothetical protein